MSYFVTVMTGSFISSAFISTLSLSATSGALRMMVRLAHKLILSASLLLIIEFLFYIHSVKHCWVVPSCCLKNIAIHQGPLLGLTSFLLFSNFKSAPSWSLSDGISLTKLYPIFL